MPSYTAKQADRRMGAIPLWARRAKAIHRTFVFEGFEDAVAFVNRVARAAEKSDHHPDIDIRWNKVRLVLSTHSEGGLTGKDFSMARKCSALFSGRPGKH